MAFEIGKAFVDCHLVTEAESYLNLVQTVPSFRPAEVFELLYSCAKERGDTDQCIDFLLKALQALPETSIDKRRQLAVLLTQLYDERGELLHSVEITNKYLSKSRHIVGEGWYCHVDSHETCYSGQGRVSHLDRPTLYASELPSGCCGTVSLARRLGTVHCCCGSTDPILLFTGTSRIVL